MESFQKKRCLKKVSPSHLYPGCRGVFAAFVFFNLVSFTEHVRDVKEEEGDFAICEPYRRREGGSPAATEVNKRSAEVVPDARQSAGSKRARVSSEVTLDLASLNPLIISFYQTFINKFDQGFIPLLLYNVFLLNNLKLIHKLFSHENLNSPNRLVC